MFSRDTQSGAKTMEKSIGRVIHERGGPGMLPGSTHRGSSKAVCRRWYDFPSQSTCRRWYDLECIPGNKKAAKPEETSSKALSGPSST